MSRRHDSLWWIPWLVFTYSVYPVYSVVMHARYGQTLGKMAVKIRVMDVAEERTPTWQQAALRDIGDLILVSVILIYRIMLVIHHNDSMQALSSSTLMTVVNGADDLWFLLEFITMLTNQKRRAVHDFIAGTVVVRIGFSEVTTSRLEDEVPILTS